jgi:hypothetical protein
MGARRTDFSENETAQRARTWAVQAARGWTRHGTVDVSARLARHEVHQAMPGQGQGRAERPEWTSIVE